MPKTVNKMRFGIFCSQEDADFIWEALLIARSQPGNGRLPMHEFCLSAVKKEAQNVINGKHSITPSKA